MKHIKSFSFFQDDCLNDMSYVFTWDINMWATHVLEKNYIDKPISLSYVAYFRVQKYSFFYKIVIIASLRSLYMTSNTLPFEAIISIVIIFNGHIHLGMSIHQEWTLLKHLFTNKFSSYYNKPQFLRNDLFHGHANTTVFPGPNTTMCAKTGGTFRRAKNSAAFTAF